MKENINRSEHKIDREELLWSYHSEIQRYLSVFKIPYDQLDDAVQDTFITAWQNIHKLRDETRIKSWLFAIAKNVGRKYAAKYAKRSAHFTSLEEQSGILHSAYENKFKVDDEVIQEVSDETLFTIIEEFTSEELLKALNKLKPKEKSVLILYYVYEHNLLQISKMIGEGYSNTRSIASRAKMKLRVLLENKGDK